MHITSRVSVRRIFISLSQLTYQKETMRLETVTIKTVHINALALDLAKISFASDHNVSEM